MNEAALVNPYLVGLVTFFAGLFLGHRLTISRDKRKEFNEAAKPIRSWLIKETNNPSPFSERPTESEIDAFVHYLPIWKRSGFHKAYERQQSERKKHETRDKVGSCFYKENQSIIKALNRCLTYTKRR